MAESAIKKIKTFLGTFDSVAGLAERQTYSAFNTLLTAMGLGDEAIARLVKPLEDSARREARAKYTWSCRVILGLVMALAVAAVCILFTASPLEDRVSRTLLIVAFFVCIFLLLILYGIYDFYRIDALLADKKKLLYLRFMQEGSLGPLLNEQAASAPSVHIGGLGSAEEDEPHKFFGPKAAKAAALLMVLVHLVIGSVMIFNMMAAYEPVSDGMALITWSDAASGEVVIPAEKNGKPVTTIGKLAFENRRDITRIVVPDTVTVIDSGAFRGCTGLEEIVLPDTLTVLGAEAFSGCASLERFTLPKGVTEIRAETFRDCTSLREVTLHEGLKTIRADAFYRCTALTGITLPEGLTELPARAFYYCENLASIVIPASVKEIGAYAFEGCSSLAEVNFLSEMADGRIGAAAFRRCTSLTKFDVPKGVTDLSAEAFYGCSALEEVTLPPVLTENKIGESLFYGCKSLKSIVIPEGVTKISAHAFQYCTALSSVTVPDSLQTIGSSAFRDCKSLKDIYLPEKCNVSSNSFKSSPTKVYYGPLESQYKVINGQATLVKWSALKPENGVAVVPAEYNGVPVTAIGNGAFNERTDIREVVLPDTITVIGEEAFYRCTALAKINLPPKLTIIKSWAFAYCSKLKSVTIPESIRVIDGMAFYEADLSDGVNMPESLPELDIGYAAFTGTQLKSIMLPEGLDRVTGFNDCDELIAVRIPSTAQTIGFSAFESCSKLSVVEMPETTVNGAMEIEENAFRNCKSLKEITLPENCKVDSQAFSGSNTALKYFNVQLVKVNSTPAAQSTAAAQTGGAATPAPTAATAPASRESYGVYEERDGEAVLAYWFGDAVGVIEVASMYGGLPVTAIGPEAFKYQYQMEAVKLPDSIRSIGSQAFFYCFGMEKINMPKQLEEIGAGAFEFCEALKEVTLPAGLRTIGDRAFKNTALKELTIPDSVQSIGAYAFSECSSLRTLTLRWECDMDSTALSKTSAWVNYIGMPEKTAVAVVKPVDGVYTVKNGEATLVSWGENIQGTLTVPAEYQGAPVTMIGTNAFKNRTDVTGIVLPDSIREIGSYAFSGCVNLTEITLPAGLEKIGARALENCTALESIVLPAGVQTISQYAFSGCVSLSSLTLPDTLTSLGAYVFSRCEKLTTITLPQGCQAHRNAFSGCPQLTVEYK